MEPDANEQRQPFSSHDPRVQRALQVGGEELWEINVSRGIFTRLLNSLPVAGAKDGDAISLDELQGTAHPDDAHKIREGIAHAVAQPGQTVEVLYRSRNVDGRWLWILVRGQAFHADNGELLIAGASRDVTRIQEDSARLSLALRSAGEELWEVDLVADRLTRDNVLTDLDLATIVETGGREALRNFLHPDDRSVLIQAFQRAVAAPHGTFLATYRARAKDGSYRWLSSHGLAFDPTAEGVPTRIIGTTRDVTAHHEQETRMRLALWGSEAELWDIDLEHRQVEREFQLTQFDLENAGGRLDFANLLAQVHFDDQDTLVQQIRAGLNAQSDAFEAVFRLKNREGQWRWVVGRARVVERNDAGKAQRMMGTLLDITEIKRAEQQLRDMNEALEERVRSRTQELSVSNQALTQSLHDLRTAQKRMVETEKMAALGSLVAGIAHEINTPIGVSVTAASHLKSVMDGLLKRVSGSANSQAVREFQQASEAAELVLRNLARADQLIKSFKQVAIDQTDDQLRDIDLDQYIGEILMALRPALKRRDLELSVNCPAGLVFKTYPAAIYQVLSNLIMNSLTHGFPDGRGGKIDIAATLEQGVCHIHYQDNGVGINTETKRRIFEPFFTTRRNSGGSGLGMHICYNLITQRLHGEIEVDSAPNEGIRFAIHFPVGVV